MIVRSCLQDCCDIRLVQITKATPSESIPEFSMKKSWSSCCINSPYVFPLEGMIPLKFQKRFFFFVSHVISWTALAVQTTSVTCSRLSFNYYSVTDIGRTIHSTKTISLSKTKAIGRMKKAIVAMKVLCYFPCNTPDTSHFNCQFINPRCPRLEFYLRVLSF